MKSIKPKKSLGQNFLIDEEALTDIARSLDIASRHIIEVGPGYGALTEYILSHHPASLDLIELDPDMIEILDERYMAEDRLPEIADESEHIVKTTPIAIHHQDVLTYSPPYDDYSVVANIPYYITSPILFHFLYPYVGAHEKSQKQEIRGKKIFSKGVYSDVNDGEINFINDEVRGFSDFSPPTEMVIMMQKEVGEKILEGRARKPHHSYLSLAMELACEDIEIVRYVGRESFDPPPKVDSIVLKFSVKSSRDRETEEKLLALWRYAFTQPRKTLMSNLRGTPYDLDRIKAWILECGYDEKVRAEQIGLEEWGNFIDK